MEQEKNRSTLKQALDRLPQYEPGKQLWRNIEAKIEQPAAGDDNLPLAHLPAYTPPPDVWNNISRNLEADKKEKRRPLLSYLSSRWMQAAAALVLLIAAGIWLMREPGPRIQMAYAQEEMSQFGQLIDWNEEEASFERIEKELAAANRPELNLLKEELTELTAAKQEVVEMMQSYGQDPKLINQLGDIERERSEVYRQIIDQM
jgi:hypothetical protein